MTVHDEIRRQAHIGSEKSRAERAALDERLANEPRNDFHDAIHALSDPQWAALLASRS